VSRPASAALLRCVLIGCVLLGCVVLGGCGNRELRRPPPSGPTETTVRPGPDGVQAVDVDVGDDYRFSPAVINVQVGRIRLTLHHVGQGAPHTLYAAAVPGMQITLVRSGETQSVQFTATRPGRYQFVCTIHEAQGQTGTLVVAPK
jgi:plastocyanin